MLTENNFLLSLTNSINYGPSQFNRILESDAELIFLNDQLVLAITTDSLVEEIDTGLYSDPYHIGWMCAVSNFSDLAAVGAIPKGLLINLQITEKISKDFISSVMKGIEDVCQDNHAYVVGGDTNLGKNFQVAGTAFGVIEDGNIIMRKGCNQGDQIYISGRLGSGAAFALDKIVGDNKSDSIKFFPKARTKEGQIIRQTGNTCIDTSDGFFPAISNIMSINKCGALIDLVPEKIIRAEYKKKCQSAHMPLWFFLAGPHGEFELLFTVDKNKEKNMLEASEKINWKPIRIGEIIKEPIMNMKIHNTNFNCNPDNISNLYQACNGKLDHYIEELFKIDGQWKQLQKM